MAEYKSFGTIERKSIQTTPTINEKCKFTWVIKNFQGYTSNVGSFNESPHFYSDNNEECKWSVDIYLNGCEEKTSDYVGIRAYLFSEVKHVNRNFAFKCSVLNTDGKERLARLVEVKKGIGCIPNFVSKTNLSKEPELLPDGELRIACEILDLSETCVGMEAQDSQNSQNEICKALFDTKKFSDFKLIVQGKEFCVHRAILSVRSPVFEAMFESNMRETSKGEAHIDDIEPEVMDQLLRFAYIGKLESEDLVEKLLVAADKYQFDILRSRCETILAKKLNVDNVYDILLLADGVNATDLKAKAIEFFDDNKKKLVKTHDFKSLIGLFPKELLIDITYANALKP